jgi:hypothetical protein
MKKTYRLIKEYPTSRKLGFEMTADDSDGYLPNPLFWREVIKLDVPIGTVFTCENNILTIDSIDSDNKVKVTWSNGSFIHTIEEVNQFFKDGSWKLYKKKPTKLDVTIGTVFTLSDDDDDGDKYTVDSIKSNGKVKIVWGDNSAPYSVEDVNEYFKNGTWKVYKEPIKLDIPIGTKFTTSYLDKMIYTIDSITLDNRVKISWVNLNNEVKFSLVDDLIIGLRSYRTRSIGHVNKYFKDGTWKVYVEPIKLDVPIGTKFKFKETIYTIDSITLDKKVNITSGTRTLSHLLIETVNRCFIIIT